MTNALIAACIGYVEELFKGNADGHDLDHTMRVYRTALAIAKEEAACDLQVVSLAALLHDADDYKLFNTVDYANARRFLEGHGVDPLVIEKVIEAIDSVSFSKNRGKHPTTLEGKIVQDADRLDALGAIGIARTFAYGGKHGRDLASSVQHFYDKLFLLKDEMNTASGRRLAQERHRFMEVFMEEFQKETE